jgi:integrase
VVPFTDDEVQALQAAAPAVALTLGLGAGLRQSEATELTLDRIDFLRRKLTVDRQLVTPKAGDPTFGPPKTRRSYRTVPLADSVVQALAHHVEVHGVGRDELVLHGPDGRPLRRQRFGELWRRLCDSARLPAAKFHTTRHTYASVMLQAGVSVPTAAEYLGHSPGVLLATYAHLLPGDHDRARLAVEAAFTDAGSRVTSVSGC